MRARYLVFSEVGGIMDGPEFFETSDQVSTWVADFHDTYDTKEQGYANYTVVRMPAEFDSDACEVEDGTNNEEGW